MLLNPQPLAPGLELLLAELHKVVPKPLGNKKHLPCIPYQGINDLPPGVLLPCASRIIPLKLQIDGQLRPAIRGLHILRNILGY